MLCITSLLFFPSFQYLCVFYFSEVEVEELIKKLQISTSKNDTDDTVVILDQLKEKLETVEDGVYFFHPNRSSRYVLFPESVRFF